MKQTLYFRDKGNFLSWPQLIGYSLDYFFLRAGGQVARPVVGSVLSRGSPCPCITPELFAAPAMQWQFWAGARILGNSHRSRFRTSHLCVLNRRSQMAMETPQVQVSSLQNSFAAPKNGPPIRKIHWVSFHDLGLKVLADFWKVIQGWFGPVISLSRIAIPKRYFSNSTSRFPLMQYFPSGFHFLNQFWICTFLWSSS